MIEMPGHKTKIVCTIGPSSSSEAVIEDLLRSGMNVARLNFAHGTFENHKEIIYRIRRVSERLNRPCMILGDLPGPKIRIGKLHREHLLLEKGESVTLTTKVASPSETDIPVGYKGLTESVSAGGIIYLNDGFVQLQVEDISGTEVRCRVIIGGELFSYKGLNLPGAKIYLDTVTDKDLAVLNFGLNEGIDAFSVSFAERASDILKVRQFAEAKGRAVYVVAKIERAEALENIDEILEAADAIMIARGDLGVQIPLEEVPVVQKRLIRKANLRGRPVITATQMLVSMTRNIRPTRAEVSDVANAILDGTDAVMLSEETAVGRYPVEATAMLARIASSTERQRQEITSFADLAGYFRTGRGHKKIAVEDIMALNALEGVRALGIRYVISPTKDGNAPRRISRFKPDCWILALCGDTRVRNFLTLSYGVSPILLGHEADMGDDAVLRFIVDKGLCQEGARVVLTETTPSQQSDVIHSLKVIRLKSADLENHKV